MRPVPALSPAREMSSAGTGVLIASSTESPSPRHAVRIGHVRSFCSNTRADALVKA